MNSVQTLVWLSGTPTGRVLEHADEEWLASIGRQLHAEKEREKKWLDEKKEYDKCTKKYEDYMKWCEDNNKKPSALNHLKYKFRNKAEKGKEPKQQEQAESPEAGGAATSDQSKPSSRKSGKSISGKVKHGEIEAGDKPAPATEKSATNTLTNEQVSQDEQPQTSAQPTAADAATETADIAKGESDDAQNTVKTDHDEVKATSLTLEQEIEELKKQIAILTMKIGDGVKET